MDADHPLARHDDDEMFLTHTNASDAELIAELIGACLIAVAPFLAVGLVAGYVTGRFIKDPWPAAWASGLVGLLSFWASMIGAVAVFIGGGAGASAGAILAIFFYVAFFASPVFIVLALVMYLNRRAKLGHVG